MGGLTPGVTRITVRDLATMMIAVSDNSATNVLIDRVWHGECQCAAGFARPGSYSTAAQDDGLEGGQRRPGEYSTPVEMMTLLEDLYRGKILNKSMTDDFFTMLSTHKQGFLSRDLPEGLKIANKPGELEGVRNDSGVVFVENRPYVICVMTTYLRRERDGEERSEIFRRQLIECLTGWRGPANTGEWFRRQMGSSRRR